jgi:hypothetical protein
LARVYVSHAVRTAAWRRICTGCWLIRVTRCFLDSDRRDGIRVGEDWKQRLYAQLRGADAVVCAVSSSYGEPVVRH